MFRISRIKEKIQDLSISIQKKIVEEALNLAAETSFVSDGEAEERLFLCETCEEFDPSSRKCQNCGCFVDLKTKVKKLPFVDPEACPLNKW